MTYSRETCIDVTLGHYLRLALGQLSSQLSKKMLLLRQELPLENRLPKAGTHISPCPCGTDAPARREVGVWPRRRLAVGDVQRKEKTMPGVSRLQTQLRLLLLCSFLSRNKEKRRKKSNKLIQRYDSPELSRGEQTSPPHRTGPRGLGKHLPVTQHRALYGGSLRTPTCQGSRSLHPAPSEQDPDPPPPPSTSL